MLIITSRAATRVSRVQSQVWGRNSSVGSELGSLSSVMQSRDFFPLELAWVLTPFPKTLSDESMNGGLDAKDTGIDVLDR